jgi:23S rRNA-/tRNA-specific pseudouridylate synthase
MLSILKYDYSLPMVYSESCPLSSDVSCIHLTCIHPAAANRLDRLTSGVMVVALSKKKSQDLGAAFQGGLVEKEYVARVVGEFPA